MIDQILWILAVAAVACWLYLIFRRGGFWRADQRLPKVLPQAGPDIVAVIPARNEVETIANAVRSLLNQEYQGALSVIVVDDNSTDGTAAALSGLDSEGRLTVVSGAALLPGWTGKMWAISQGLSVADKWAPEAEFVLLTDADIAHGAGVVEQLVAKAQADKLDLVSLMVLLRTDNFWEKFLCPAFVFFFQKLYPFPWVNDPGRKMAGAAGGCMLMRRDALDRVGGVARIKDKVIDDCALAREIKRDGSIWLGLAETSRSLRGYDGLSGLWDMVARTAFVQLNQSWWMLAGTVGGMAVIYLAPPLTLGAGILLGEALSAFLGGVAWGLMAFAYLPTLRLYRRPVIEAFSLPVAGVIYTAMTVDSAFRTVRGAGASWKGRSYGDIGRSGHDA